jgi:hypothetical protein
MAVKIKSHRSLVFSEKSRIVKKVDGIKIEVKVASAELAEN